MNYDTMLAAFELHVCIFTYFLKRVTHIDRTNGR